MIKTRNGIYKNINYSTYTYNTGQLTFVFSSEFYRRKFIDTYMNHRKQISESLSNRFKFSIDVSFLADLVLYTKIEKRGFLLYTKGGEKICQKPQRLELESKIKIK